MNRLFSPYLRKFVIVFFEDILVYSASLTAHMEHLECVLSCLQEHQFFVKRSKCAFGVTTLEYLGHIISGHGVEVDPKKVVAVREWPVPMTQRQVRGFLGLAGYYRRFIKGYETMAAPLTNLLRKEDFKWGESESTAFETLKLQLSTTLVLSLPDFKQTFVVETDAADEGIGAPGAQNQVADAFSRMFEDKKPLAASFMSLSQPLLELMDELKAENRDLEELRVLHQQLDQGIAAEGFRRQEGLVIFLDRYFVGKESKLKPRFLREYHDTPSLGHGGVKKMMVGLATMFYWRGMHKSVEEYIKNCRICQQTKYSTQAVGGYLQPLATPSAVWEDVSMDFITGMSLSKGFTVVLVVVDRFSKYAHFAPLTAGFNAHKVAEFWTQLFKLSGTQLNHSTAYHPESDGQTEVVNRGLEQYLRAMVGDRPTQWVHFLPWAEYCYNTTYHSSIKMTPYQALYGKVPLAIIPYPPGLSKVAAVDDALCERDIVLRQLKHNLLAAKNRMEQKAKRKRREVEYQVGDRVFVKLQPYRQLTLAKRLSNKLAKRYYGPYEILERIGKVAYRLALPVDSRIHPVFHVSILKPFSRIDTDEVTALPKEVNEGRPLEQPVDICGSRGVLHNGQPKQQVLVQWAGRSPEEATWEGLTEFQSAYPTYDLGDKVIFEGRENDTPRADEGPRRTTRESVAPAWHKDYVLR
ncbi:ty3-gypsy retrotransposon protein [Tanacetum coccineum]